MKNNSTNKAIEISKGIFLKRKDEDSSWQYYFRLHNKAFRKSTKTRDRARATHIALEHYHDAKDKRKNQMHLSKFGSSEAGVFFRLRLAKETARSFAFNVKLRAAWYYAYLKNLSGPLPVCRGSVSQAV